MKIGMELEHVKCTRVIACNGWMRAAKTLKGVMGTSATQAFKHRGTGSREKYAYNWHGTKTRTEVSRHV